MTIFHLLKYPVDIEKFGINDVERLPSAILAIYSATPTEKRNSLTLFERRQLLKQIIVEYDGDDI
jgi:hypothetical protein